MFNVIKAQEQAIGILTNSVRDQKISHSYLFYGPDGVGKLTTALTFAMTLNCSETYTNKPCGKCSSCEKLLDFNHPDLTYIFPTPNYDISPEGEIKDDKNLEEYRGYVNYKKKSPWKNYNFKGNTAIRLDCIRLIQHRINLSLHEAKYKVFIVEKADQMNHNAANAFLKTLEEPPKDSVIILTSSKYESLLPTITSRCQKILFYKIPRRTIESELSVLNGQVSPIIKMISRIANGNMEKALDTFHNKSSEERNNMRKFVSILINKNDMEFMEFSENYKSSKNIGELSEIIKYLIIWLGDLVFYQECRDEIVNIDMIDELHHVTSNKPLIRDYISELIVFLEQMLHRIEGNVNPHLIIIEIYNRLKKNLIS